jgi:hypothetical protein
LSGSERRFPRGQVSCATIALIVGAHCGALSRWRHGHHARRRRRAISTPPLGSRATARFQAGGARPYRGCPPEPPTIASVIRRRPTCAASTSSSAVEIKARAQRIPTRVPSSGPGPRPPFPARRCDAARRRGRPAMVPGSRGCAYASRVAGSRPLRPATATTVSMRTEFGSTTALTIERAMKCSSAASRGASVSWSSGPTRPWVDAAHAEGWLAFGGTSRLDAKAAERTYGNQRAFRLVHRCLVDRSSASAD